MHDASFNWNMKYLFVHLHAAPKSDVIFDLLSRILRLRIVPSGILIRFLADLDVIVTRKSLPRTGAVRIARLEKFPLDGIRRKIMIALDDNRFIGFRQQRILPNGFHNRTSFLIAGLTRHAAKLCENVGIVSLIPVAKARP